MFCLLLYGVFFSSSFCRGCLRFLCTRGAHVLLVFEPTAQEIFLVFPFLESTYSPRLQKDVLVADISCILADRVFVTGIPVTNGIFIVI
jgi:hypothetical protein